MRILFLNDDYPPLGNSSVSSVVERLRAGLEKRGHETGVITTHRRETNAGIVRDGSVTSLPVSYRTSLRHWKCVRNADVSRMLEREIPAFRPDVIHAHNLHAFLTYDALRIARKNAKTVCITMHDVMSFAYARLTTEKFLNSGGRDARVTVIDQIRSAGLQWNPFRNLMIRRALKNADHVIAVSDALKRALEENGIPGAVRIHHGIDRAWTASPDAVASFRRTQGLDGRKTILFGGRLSLDKGAVPLLKALQIVRRSVPNVLLLILGNPDRWQALVRAAGLSEDLSANMRCAGWLDREQTAAAFGAVDLVTTPSLCLDTFNLMNLEAMSAGKPVVGTVFGGTPEVVEDGVTGYVLDPRNADVYAGRLAELLSDDAKARTMGEAGKTRAREEFCLERQIADHLRLYQS